MSTALANRVRVDAAQTLSDPQKTQVWDNFGVGTAAFRTRIRVGTEARSPDDFAGATDHAKLQAAINYAVTPGGNFPRIVLDRWLNITGGGPILINKNPWHDRRMLYIIGDGGGITKTDAGPIWSSATENTGDVTTQAVNYKSTAGAGTIVWDADKLVRIMSSDCDYRTVDRVVSQTIDGRYLQSLRLHHEHIVGGAGPAFECIESYDTTLTSTLTEDRPAVWWNIAPATGRFQNRNLRMTDNVMENLADIPIKLGATWSTLIVGNYFEQNGQGKNADPANTSVNGTPAHIDAHTIQPLYWRVGLVIEGNMFSMRTSQKAARTVSILLGRSYNGRPVSLKGNVADGGTLIKFGDTTYAAAATDGSNYVEGGDVVYPSHASKVVGVHPTSGATSARPKAPNVGHVYLDTSINKAMTATAPGTHPFASLRLTAGASTSGSVQVTLAGVLYTVPVVAGDALTQVRDKIVAAGVETFHPWVPSAFSTHTVRFDSIAPGQITNSPVFSGNGTGVTHDYFGLDGPGSDATWVDVATQRTRSTKTASYTLVATDDIVVFNGATLTATLPSAVTAGNGRAYTIKNVNSTALTVASTAGTIDGAATQSLAQWAKAEYISDGTNWLTI